MTVLARASEGRVKDALERLGVKRLLLAIHDPSFPSDPDEDIGRGAPTTRAAGRLLAYAARLGFTGIQLGPQGQTSRDTPSPYDGTTFARHLGNVPLARFATSSGSTRSGCRATRRSISRSPPSSHWLPRVERRLTSEAMVDCLHPARVGGQSARGPVWQGGRRKGEIMTQSNDGLQERLARWTLILGVAQVTVGCFVGFIPPTAVPWFRGIVMSHIEYTANGVLMIALGFLLREMHLGSVGLWVWFASLQIGTWTNGTAGLVGALLGYSSKLMPTINEKFPAPHGLDHPLVTGLLLVCGVTIIVALLLTLYGLLRRPRSTA